MNLKSFSIVLCTVYVVVSEDIGESCSQDGVAGTCTALSQCQTVLDNPRTQWWKLHRCGTKDLEPIICCVGSAASPGPVATTPRLGSPTTEYSPPDYEYHTSELLAGGCAASVPAMTPVRTGRRAWDKCIDYQLELVYPCERGVALMQDMRRANHCKDTSEEFGSYERGDYPYMVLLGHGHRDSWMWVCSGTLLSDRFILTAAHCTDLEFFGQISFARVGFLKRTNDHQDVINSQLHKIKRVIRHPNHNGIYSLHDIALLETETRIVLNRWTVPACLDVFGGDVSEASTTGWDVTIWGGYTDKLRKMTFTRLRSEDCLTKYWNFTEATEMCYRGRSSGPLSCGNYNGGPLVIKNSKVHCMATVVGVTSGGRGCGRDLAVYTKVSPYVSWIESVVWP